MKKALLLMIVLLSVGGCQSIITHIDKPYHEVAWYQKGKSTAQARRDCDECIYEVGKAANPSQTLFQRCMNLRGYRLCKSADLEAGQIPIQQVPGRDSIFMFNDVGDGTNERQQD